MGGGPGSAQPSPDPVSDSSWGPLKLIGRGVTGSEMAPKLEWRWGRTCMQLPFIVSPALILQGREIGPAPGYLPGSALMKLDNVGTSRGPRGLRGTKDGHVHAVESGACRLASSHNQGIGAAENLLDQALMDLDNVGTSRVPGGSQVHMSFRLTLGRAGFKRLNVDTHADMLMPASHVCPTSPLAGWIGIVDSRGQPAAGRPFPP